MNFVLRIVRYMYSSIQQIAISNWIHPIAISLFSAQNSEKCLVRTPFFIYHLLPSLIHSLFYRRTNANAQYFNFFLIIWNQRSVDSAKFVETIYEREKNEVLIVNCEAIQRKLNHVLYFLSFMRIIWIEVVATIINHQRLIKLHPCDRWFIEVVH